MGDQALEINPSHAKPDGPDPKPSHSGEGIEALDKLAGEAAARKVAEQHQAESTAAPAPKAESTAAPAPKAESTAAPKAESTARVAAESTARVAAESTATPKDPLDEFQLPDGSKPKSGEAFESLRGAAKERIAEATNKLAEAENKVQTLTQQVADLQAQVGKVSPEVQKKLDEAEQMRATVDIENDPEFKKFDAVIAENTDIIYKKLEETGVFTAENIERIKELGGPEKINWGPLRDKVPEATMRFIESLFVDNERARSQKTKSVEKAKADLPSYTEKRKQNEQKSITDTADAFVKNLPWANQKEIPANATAAQRAEIEAWNTSAKIARSTLDTYLADRSPAKFAELAVGTLIAYQFKANLEQLNKAYADLKKTSGDNLAKVTKERDEAVKQLTAIKKAQLPRGPGGQVPPAAQRKVDLNTSGSEALDKLASQVKKPGDVE